MSPEECYEICRRHRLTVGALAVVLGSEEHPVAQWLAGRRKVPEEAALLLRVLATVRSGAGAAATAALLEREARRFATLAAERPAMRPAD